jgi:outer membrane protein
MKKLIALSCTLALILCAATTAHAQAIKIGTVDMDKIFKSYYKTKEAEARINEARSTAKKELDDRMDTYKQTMDEINKLNDELTNGAFSESKKADISKTRDEKISQFKDLEREITDFRTQKEKYLQDQAVRMRNGIVDEIMALIQAKIKSENYDYVFDKSGPSMNGLPIVIYARDPVDFSDDIIAALNKTKPKDSSGGPGPAASPAASAPAKTPKAQAP